MLSCFKMLVMLFFCHSVFFKFYFQELYEQKHKQEKYFFRSVLDRLQILFLFNTHQ